MSGGSSNFYYSSNTSKSSRGSTKREDENRDNEQDLPPIRDVLRDQFEEPYDPAYNLRGMGHALPHQSSRSSQPNLRLPPIRDSSSRQRQDDIGYTTTPGFPSTHRHDRASTSTRNPNPSRAPPTNLPTYQVLAPSRPGGSLVPVSSSHTKPPGILRGHALPSSLHSDNDPKKKFECHECGRKMERYSVYTQHMLTHTDERPHVCLYCPKAFNSKSNLNRHMLTHGNRWNEDDSTDNHGHGSSSKGYYTSSRQV